MGSREVLDYVFSKPICSNMGSGRRGFCLFQELLAFGSGAVEAVFGGQVGQVVGENDFSGSAAAAILGDAVEHVYVGGVDVVLVESVYLVAVVVAEDPGDG